MTLKLMLFMLTTLIGTNSIMCCRSISSEQYPNFYCKQSNGETIKIYYRDNKTLYIQHNGELATIELKTFPKFEINETFDSVVMMNCTVEEGSFGSVFEYIGLKKGIRVFYGSKIGSALDGRFSSGFETLETLILFDNGIRRLNEHVFQNMPNLISLDLFSNDIVVVHPNAFRDLTKLTTLELSRNKLQSLSEGIFENQKQLVVLKLDDNRLESLTKETFRGLDSLQELHLQTNDFEYLSDDVFHYLPRLRIIALGGNDMIVPRKIFADNENLVSVQLEVVTIGNGLQLSDLQELTICNSNLNSISGLSNITKLSITESEPNSFLAVTSFQNLSSTRIINLSMNNLNHLDDGLFDGLVNLLRLQLFNNNLENISG